MPIVIQVSGIELTDRKLNSVVNQVLDDLTDTLNAELKSRTPIDTGQARRGWAYRAGVTSRNIENRVPYIDLLEKGRSRQAPNGFVKQSIAAAIVKIKKEYK